MAVPVELTPDEERRLWAKAIGDLETFGDLLSERAEYIIPGEHVTAFKDAWSAAKSSFREVQMALLAQKPSDEDLEAANLDGANGALKRSLLQQLRDTFLRYFVREPRSEERMRLAAQSGARYADMGAMVLDSLGACLAKAPVVAIACKAAGEGLFAVKHLLERWGCRPQ
jgi:hypothetical protein